MGCDIHMVLQIKDGDKWKTSKVLDIARNYKLFSVLANVRNGYGFAGVDTGNQIPFISEPKGLPEDLEVLNGDYIQLDIPIIDYYEITDTFSLGDHSFSWLSGEELLNYNWNQEIVCRGMILPDRVTFDKYNRPSEYCGGTNNPTYIQHQWTIPVIECINLDFKNVLEDLQRLELKDLKRVRLVFGFDS